MDLVDREDETRLFADLFKLFLDDEDGVARRAVVICSEPGFGKTSIVNKAFDQAKVRPFRSGSKSMPSGTVPPGYFFRRLYDDFSSNDITVPIEDLIGGMNLTAGVTLGGIAGISGGVSRSETSKMIGKANHMVSVFNKRKTSRRPVFYIENAERIDEASLELIGILRDKVPTSCFVFEFTTYDDSDVGEARKFSEGFFEGLESSCVKEIEKMEIGYARQVVFGDNCPLAESLIQSIYNQSSGNLWLFKQKCSEISGRGLFSTSNMTQADKAILALVALQEDFINMEDLGGCLRSEYATISQEDDITATMEKLVEHGLISYDPRRGYKAIARDVAEQCLNDPISRNTACRLVIYQIRQAANKTLDDWFKLLNAQLRIHDEGIIDTLGHITREVGTARYDEAFAARASEMVNRLHASTVTTTGYVERAILDAYMSAGDYEGMSAFASAIEHDDDLLDMYKFLANVAASRSFEAERQAHCLMAKHASNTRIKLLVALGYASYCMRYRERGEAIAYLNWLLSQSAYRTYPEYYWAMKQRSVYLSTEDALRDLELCSNYFESGNMEDLSARARITYALRLALSGKVKEALDIFVEDFSSGKDPTCPECYYLNNIAACLLMLGENLQEACEHLAIAMEFPATNYVKTLITCNLFSAHLLVGNYSNAGEMAQTLLERSEHDYSASAPKHMCLTNLLAYCRAANPALLPEVERRLLMLQAVADSELAACIECQLHGGRLPQNNRYRYVTKLGFRPGFIGFWQTTVAREISDALIAQHG